MSLARFPRVQLGHLPTPLERMDRLRAALGPDCPTLYVKRDDCTTPSLGGNKARALELLLAGVAPGDTILTVGSTGVSTLRDIALRGGPPVR